MNPATHHDTVLEGTNSRLFDVGIEERILLSVHLMGKPTAAQLHRLHSGEVSTLRRMQSILRRLSSGPDRLLNFINPIDIANPIRSLPFVYLETTRSRRLIEQVFGVPYRRVPPVPSRDWRFLRHDVEMCDELVAFELTAKKLGVPFGYQPHIDADGKHIYPKVTIHWDGLTYKLRPQPDKTLIIGDTHYILEHDCGEETIECGNIIRDATIGRKHLVYDALFRSQAMKERGWNKAVVLYVIDSKRGTKTAARKRIKSCLEKIPDHMNKKRAYFVDRPTFLEQVDSVAHLQWVRGNGALAALPRIGDRCSESTEANLPMWPRRAKN